MIVDQMEVFDMMASALSPSPTSSVLPIPTVVPDPPLFYTVTPEGVRTLWVVFVIMVISAISFTGLSWNVPVSKRFFHILTTLMTVVSALSYFGMATGHATTLHRTSVRHAHEHVPDTFQDVYRQIFWAHTVDWTLTMPMILLNLGFLSGLSGAHTLIAIASNLSMVWTGFFSGFGFPGTPQKWGWFTLSCISYLVMVWNLSVNGRNTVKARGNYIASIYSQLTGFGILVWTVYPIIWGIAVSNKQHLSVDGEIIAYAVLDILHKVVLSGWLLISQSRRPEATVEMTGFWTYGSVPEGRVRLIDSEA